MAKGGVHSLHLEVVSSQFGIVDIQHCLGVEPGGHADLQMGIKEIQGVRKCRSFF